MYVYLLLCENEKFGKIYLKFSLLNLLIIWVWIDFRFIDNIKWMNIYDIWVIEY